MRLLLFIAVMGMMSSCCTKMDCPCDVLTLDFRINRNDYTQDEISSFEMVITDKQFRNVQTIRAFFQDNSFPVYNGMLSTLGDIEDYNWILKNDITGQRDTISEITYVAKDSVFECNNCFLKKDEKHCTAFSSRKLKHNRNTVNSYHITIIR